MTIWNIVLESDDIDKLSVHEVCSLCVFISDHIITHFSKVHMVHSSHEQYNLQQCQEIIQNIFGAYTNANLASEPDEDTNIEITEFTCIAFNNNQNVDVLHMTLDPHCFDKEGPVALIKLWTSIVCTSLWSLKNKKVFTQKDTFNSHTKCIIRVVNALYNILSPISLNGNFRVSEKTTFSSVVMTISRTLFTQQKDKDAGVSVEFIES
jgi:hypothetical protein